MFRATFRRRIPTFSVAELSGGDAALQDCVWVRFGSRTPVPLSRTSAALWATVFSASYFSDPHLLSEIGLPFVFQSLDNRGVAHETGPAYLFRVIEGVPVALTPAAQDTVGPRPTLVWEAFNAGFHPFFYRPAVYVSAEDFIFTVWTSELLPDSLHRVTVTDSLADGPYYWTVTVVDTFDNSSRSKEGIFVVRNGVAG